MNLTAKLRVLYAALFAIAILTALGAWVFADKSPADLTGVLTTLAMAIGIGEASNVGKRATFKAEAVEVP